MTVLHRTYNIEKVEGKVNINIRMTSRCQLVVLIRDGWIDGGDLYYALKVATTIMHLHVCI